MENGPSELQIALFSALEDVHDLTSALVVLLVDEAGTTLAVSGDESEIPGELRAALSGSKLAQAGSVRALLEDVDFASSVLNVSLFAVRRMVLAILFDAEADLVRVQAVGKEASEMIAELFDTTTEAPN